ncbi:MAG: type II toxin-antitoxin system ParD family antitoxin [Chthoniobacterales bacterium]
MTHVDISLTPELNDFVKRSVNSGLFHNISEVVANGLHVLKAQQETKLQALRADIAVGVEQAERGEFVEFDAESIIQSGRKRQADDQGK